jgi:hypothetical protein
MVTGLSAFGDGKAVKKLKYDALLKNINVGYKPHARAGLIYGGLPDGESTLQSNPSYAFNLLYWFRRPT